MTTQDTGLVEAAYHAIEKLRADEVEGCFRPNWEPEEECADQECYCVRWTNKANRAVLTALLPHLSEESQALLRKELER